MSTGRFACAVVAIALVNAMEGCTLGVNSPSQEVTYSAKGTSNGSAPVQGFHAVRVKNIYGPLIVSGANPVGTISWAINGQTTAPSQQTANIALGGITASVSAAADTMVVQVAYSSGAVGAIPSALLSLEIPYALPCVIDGVSGDIDVNDLDSTLTIRNGYAVNIIRQNGSCQVSTVTGNVKIEIAVPAGGYCRATVVTGNLLILLPAAASAAVYEKVVTGTLSQSGLVFASSSQQGGVFTGVLGSGAGEIHAEVVTGNIMLQGE